jgi:hypothetical protein
MNDPTPNGHDGRDARGRFVKGNAGGPGNPYARRIGELRSILIEELEAESEVKSGSGTIRASRFRLLILRLLKSAISDGDVAAAKLVLSYALGQPIPADLVERIESLETALEVTP